MPTFNQLVRKGRQTTVKKSTAPALQKGYNSLHKKATDALSTNIFKFFQRFRHVCKKEQNCSRITAPK